MALDLRIALALEPQGSDQALDWFIGSCLCDGDVWESPRTSDSILWMRIVEREARRVQVCGKIYSIDQVLHAFWFAVERDDVTGGIRWSLHFDLDESLPRRMRGAFESCERADQVAWSIELAGTAAVEDGVLAVVAGATEHRSTHELCLKRGS